jgi:hypothetical protein
MYHARYNDDFHFAVVITIRMGHASLFLKCLLYYLIPHLMWCSFIADEDALLHNQQLLL